MPIGAKDFVTIVSGLPRSGTSMMMRMVDAGGIPALTDNVRKADEDNPRGYFEYEPVKQTKQDPSWLAGAVGHSVKMVHLLLRDLPEDGFSYRVVFMRRRLEEVVASQDVMLARRGKADTPLSPEKMMALFKKQIEDIDEWVRARPSFEILHVSYNDALGDAGPVVASVNEFLGGDLDVRAMRQVVEPDLYRQRV